MTFWKAAHFKELTKEWYKRLKEDGFQDIEQDERYLKENSYKAYQGADEITRDTKLLYFTLLTHHIGRAEFKTEVDRIVLLMRSEGAKIKSICDYLSSIGESRTRVTVRIIIRRYEMAWGMREYTSNQLGRYSRK